jgi:ribonuclease P protein component
VAGLPETGAGGGAPPPPDQRLPRSRRLIRSGLFFEAYAQGDKHVGRLMVLCLRHGEGAALRVGTVTGRKVGESVARARARRLLREVFRRHRAELRGTVDLVLIARAGLPRAAWPDIERDFLGLVRRAGLLPGAAGVPA